MRKWLAMLRPNPWLARRLAMLAILVGVGVGAFCWGRQGAVSEVDAQQNPSPPKVMEVVGTPGQTTRDYNIRAVAYIYDNIPITREELGEYLIARFGAERIEFVVNRKLVEMACKSQGIEITEADIDFQLAEDIRSFGNTMTKDLFVKEVLGRFKKSLYEWREDVIRPKLAMTKLVKPLCKATPQDVQQEFEVRYGPRVECQMIVLPKDGPKDVRLKVWERAQQSEAGFNEEARKQPLRELAGSNGKFPPIHRHYPDAKIEKTAFELQDGGVSGLIEIADGSWVILRRVQAVPPDQTVRLESKAMELAREVEEKQLTQKIPEFFQRMRAQARPNILIGNNHATPPGVAAPKAPSSSPLAN